LSKRGINLVASDPTNLLGTMIFRQAKQQFVNIPGHGYWFADRPYKPAGYDPATWQQEVQRAVRAVSKGRT
jgi:hypothetical protein